MDKALTVEDITNLSRLRLSSVILFVIRLAHMEKKTARMNAVIERMMIVLRAEVQILSLWLKEAYDKLLSSPIISSIQ